MEGIPHMPGSPDFLQKARKLNEEGKFNDVLDMLDYARLSALDNADLYAERALACWRLGDVEACKIAAERALQINPSQVKALHYKGNVCVDQREYEEAIRFFEKAVRLKPDYSHPYSRLGDVYCILKHFEKGIQAYEKARKINDRDYYNYVGLGEIHCARRQYRKAVDLFTQATAHAPDRANIFHLLGNAYSVLEENDMAIDAYLKSIALDENYADPHIGIGNIYYSRKEYEKAIEAYDKCTALNAGESTPYYNKGLVYDSLEDYARSLPNFEEYVKLTKDDPDYYTLIAISRISEITKEQRSPVYKTISRLVKKIKETLLYDNSFVSHYTSLSAARALVLDASPFRLSEGAFLNDTSEGRTLFEFLAIAANMVSRRSFVAEPFIRKPFIGSFVAEGKHDDLTLWRMYGKEEKEEAKGCAITFSKDLFLENLQEKLTEDIKSDASIRIDGEFNFYRVAYLKGENSQEFVVPEAGANTESVLNECMQQLKSQVKEFYEMAVIIEEDRHDVQELLNEVAYLFKGAGYQYEHELRLVVKGVGFKKVIASGGILPRVYIELLNINPLLSQITIGPKVERADEWAAAFYYTLEKQGYPATILISHLPFK